MMRRNAGDGARANVIGYRGRRIGQNLKPFSPAKAALQAVWNVCHTPRCSFDGFGEFCRMRCAENNHRSRYALLFLLCRDKADRCMRVDK